MPLALLLHALLRCLHLVSVAGFLGSILLIDLRMAGLFEGSSLTSMRIPLVSVLHVSFIVLLLTGIGLFLRSPSTMLAHPLFLPKLALVAVGLAHAHGMRKLQIMRAKPSLRRACAVASLGLWFAVMTFSTLNGLSPAGA